MRAPGVPNNSLGGRPPRSQDRVPENTVLMEKNPTSPKKTQDSDSVPAQVTLGK